MSKLNKKQTKQTSLSREFLQNAAIDPEGALATMLLAAFGVSLVDITTMCKKMVDTKNYKLILLCLTSSVQVRGNAVFVGTGYGDVKTEYPLLVIDSGRDVDDQFNYGALHACGHMFAHSATNALGGKLLKKAGSCITGEFVTENEAGEINKEISVSWPKDEVSQAIAGMSVLTAAADIVLSSISAKAKAFPKKA